MRAIRRVAPPSNEEAPRRVVRRVTTDAKPQESAPRSFGEGVKNGKVTWRDFPASSIPALYRDNEVTVGIDPSLTAPAVSVFHPESGSACTWLYTTDKVADGDYVAATHRLMDLRLFYDHTLRGIHLRTKEVVGLSLEGYGYASPKGNVQAEAVGGLKLVLVSIFGFTNPVSYPRPIAPNTLKKFATGNGQSEKSDMKLKVYKKWGIEFSDDNECDAYALARLASALHTGVSSLAYEQEVIDSLTRTPNGSHGRRRGSKKR